jgi:hypothetical protein
VCFPMQYAAFHRAKVFLPLQLDMDKRPLSPAEAEMLYTGEQEIFFFCISHRYIMRTQDTPAGTASISTLTL